MRVQVIFAGVLAGGLLAASPAQAAIGEPATDPTGAIFRFDEWTRGQVGFNQRYTGFPNYPYMTYAMAGVDVPAQTPAAGEVFYIHVWAGLPWPQSAVDTALPEVSLPDGLSIVPGATAQPACFIVQSGYVPTRNPGCAVFPTGASGVSIPLGTYPISAGLEGGSESVHIFLPVVASGPMTAQTLFTSTRMLQSPSIIPNPLYGDASLTVSPGSSPAPNPGGGGTGTPAALVAPTQQSFTWKKGKAIVRWPAVTGAQAYRARLKVGKKWTKWSYLSNPGVSLTKLKKGKKYTLQVRATGASGLGPVASWRFTAK